MTWQTWVIHLTWAVTNTGAIAVFYVLLDSKYSRKAIMPSYVASTTFLHIVRAYCYIHYPFIPSDEIFLIFIVPVYSFIFLRLTCRDKSNAIILSVFLIFAMGMLCSLIISPAFYILSGRLLDFDFVGYDSLFGSITASVLASLVYALCLFSWRRYTGKIHARIPNAGAFLLILGGQLIYGLSQLLVVLERPVEFNVWTFFGIMIMIVGNFAFVHIMITNSMKTELEAQLNEIQHIRELEQMHYTAIEVRRQEMAKIRHDFSNQLTAAHQLILSNKGEYAEKLLEELGQSLETATDQAYCENAIVNAVLTEKKKECDSAETALETDIIMPENSGISGPHMCSIFTNLLDNAIRACSSVPVGRRKIELRTAYKGRYLHIKCINPVTDYPKKEKSGEGYGKAILSDIATHYSGNFTAEIKDGMHIAIVSVFVIG